jgi:SAM-dependent methyltransferase
MGNCLARARTTIILRFCKNSVLSNLSNPTTSWIGRRITEAVLKEKNAYSIERAIDILEKKGHIGDGKRFFEVGFGPGIALEAALTRGSSVYGLEISDAMLHEAMSNPTIRQAVEFESESKSDGKQIGHHRAELHLRDIEDGLGMEHDQQYDAVFGSHVIYFWKDYKTVLQTIKRILKPGGVAGFILAPKAGMEERGFNTGPFKQTFTGEELSQDLAQQGFVNMSVTPIMPPIRGDTQIVPEERYFVIGHAPET